MTAREFTPIIPINMYLLSQRQINALSQRFNLPFTLSRETIQENFDRWYYEFCKPSIAEFLCVQHALF